MRSITMFTVLASTGLLASCAADPPDELLRARQAYARASAGPAAKVAPAELHTAHTALEKAEASFEGDAEDYQIRDLAYVAERKAQVAEATASISTHQTTQARAKEDLQSVQSDLVTESKAEAARSQADAARSRALASRSEAAAARSQAQASESEAEADRKREALQETRAALAAAEQKEALTASRLDAEKTARIEAERREALAQEALEKLAAVEMEPRGMVITLSGSVLFGSNKAVLLPAAQRRLAQVADVLLTTRERNLIIEGHTDSVGSDRHNLDLSRRRAETVREFLVRRGYEPDRIETEGLGSSRPIAENDSAEGRANNRRVEIVVAREAQAALE